MNTRDSKSGCRCFPPPRWSRPFTCLVLAAFAAWSSLATPGAHAATPATTASPHWAFQPVQSAPPPQTSRPSADPIAAFLQSKLLPLQLELQPEADRPTLLRRATYTLHGLPPTPEELRQFVADPAPDAYERLIDRLLASPRYGERWARHWMDWVHFAETHGHDQDRIRTHAWPYRDYLIDALNRDLPYSQFLSEQIAGDALWPDDPRGVVAMGMIAAGPWDESTLRDIREDTLDRQMGRYLDRDDMVTTVMSAFASVSVHCARCHDHKFDPIPQADYYALQAVFAGVDRGNRWFDDDPSTHQRRTQLRSELRALDRREPAALNVLLSPAFQPRIAEWEASQHFTPVAWTPLPIASIFAVEGANPTNAPDSSWIAHGPRPNEETYILQADSLPPGTTGLRIEALTHDSLPQKGPGRADNGNFHLSEFFVQSVDTAGLPIQVALRSPTASQNQDGYTITHALDGNELTAWGIHPKESQPHQAAFEIDRPWHGAAPVRIVLRQSHGGGHILGRFRISTSSQPPPLAIPQLPLEIAEILRTPHPARSREQQLALALFIRRNDLASSLAGLPPPRLVYAAAADFEVDGSHRPAGAPREVQILKRGELLKPVGLARPGALHCVNLLSPDFSATTSGPEGRRRAALAAWLAHPDNPLTWRSIVNRVWGQHFGRALVDTPNDFGRMGSPPSHPELLDWLASHFRNSGGSLKSLHRLLLTSAAFRQLSRFPDAETAARHANLDADNRLLARMHRHRLDAESIRDSILALADRLDLRMGGPSDRHFDLQPGIHVTPKIDYSKFDPSHPDGSRRSVYRFLFRTLPDPFMDALDCPAGDQLTPVRNASITVQQALALWNNAFVARHSEHFARHLAASQSDPAPQVRALLEAAWGRAPSASEEQQALDHAQKHGLPSLCRVVLNSNEFLFLQ